MHITEPIPFLANIALVSHADGELSSSEVAQLESIRNELGIKKGDYSRALKLVEQGLHSIVVVGSFVEQVKNLECILRVAYADNELSPAEVELVGAFCQLIGVNQDQLDRIANEVLSSLSRTGKTCPTCGNLAASEAIFCPACGTSLATPVDSVKLGFEIPSGGIAIEFAESSAASFTKALEIAKTADSYQFCQRQKKTWHLAVYHSGAILNALPLVQSLSELRNRRVYLSGAEVDWNEVFGFSWCASQRNSAFNPHEYCFGRSHNQLFPWGCKNSNLEWVSWARWLTYGNWEKGGLMARKNVWRFDKARIAHELNTNLFKYRYCPFLVEGLASAILDLIPETINVEDDTGWEYNDAYEQLPGSIKVRATKKSGDYSYDSEFYALGVKPVNSEFIYGAMDSAFRELGITTPNARVLVK